jgi:hypothetical protein
MATWIMFNLCLIMLVASMNFQVLLNVGLGNSIIPKSTKYPRLLNERFGHTIIPMYGKNQTT